MAESALRAKAVVKQNRDLAIPAEQTNKCDCPGRCVSRFDFRAGLDYTERAPDWAGISHLTEHKGGNVTFDEEYRLFLEQVNKLAERRQSVTSTYLTVNAAIIGAVAFLFQDGYVSGWTQQGAVLVLFVAGIAACDIWRRLIAQHSTLLKWWFERLHDLEDAMEKSSKLIKQEYEALYAKKKGRAPIGLTRHETRLTWVFTVVYVVFGLAIVVTWFGG